MSLAAIPSRRGRSGLRPFVRGVAYAALAASVAVPLLRKRLKLGPAATVAATVAGPVATATLHGRTKTRDAVLYFQQMWAFMMVHELPYDDPAALRRRLKVRYPIRARPDHRRGRLPNTRLQEWFTRRDGSVSAARSRPHLRPLGLVLRAASVGDLHPRRDEKRSCGPPARWAEPSTSVAPSTSACRPRRRGGRPKNG